MEVDRTTGGNWKVRYIVLVNGRERVITTDSSGSVIVGGASHQVEVESIDERVGTGALLCLFVDGEPHEVFAERHGDMYQITVAGTRYEVEVKDAHSGQRAEPGGGRGGAAIDILQDVGEARVVSPMAGVVLDVLVEVEQDVKAGDHLAILEAMKMENEIRAPCAGVIESVHVVPGQTVNLKDVIVSIRALPDEPDPNEDV
jgi:biotin carboxyl carrier protein